MSEKFKSIKELLTAFGKSKRLHVGNTAEEIRNLIHSLHSPYGSFHRTGSVQDTNISVQGEYVKASINTSPGNLYKMTSTENNKLVYTGESTRHFHIACTLSMSSATGNVSVGLKIAKNGTPLEDTICIRKIGTAGDIGATALHADTHLSNGDYLEIYITNLTNTTAVTIDEVYFFGIGMIV